MKTESEKAYLELLKQNLLNEIKFHRSKCGVDDACNVQFRMLYELAEKAGIEFTTEERHC